MTTYLRDGERFTVAGREFEAVEDRESHYRGFKCCACGADFKHDPDDHRCGGTFKLEIATDNDAFAGDPNPEVAAILRRVLRDVEQGAASGTCRDTNGATVGEWTLEHDGRGAE